MSSEYVCIMHQIGLLYMQPSTKQNTATDYYNELLNELNQRNLYKRQGRRPYLSSVIRYALHLRYMSLQTYRL